MSAVADDEWTFEKQRSINWANASDVAAHRFLFVTLLDMHAPLAAKCRDDPDFFEQQKSAYYADTEKVVAALHKAGLFDLLPKGAPVWCASCHKSGHVLSDCRVSKHKSQNTQQPQQQKHSVLHRFRQHCRACTIEGNSALANKKEFGGGGFPARGGNKPGGGGGGNWLAVTGGDVAGRLRAIDLAAGTGEIESGASIYPFFCTRANFGLRRACEGEVVTFRAERSGDRQRAVDVTLDRTGISTGDVDYLLSECDGPKDPILILRHILHNHHDWPLLLRAAADGPPQNLGAFAFGIVCVVAFRRNLFPIHTEVMRLVCCLLCASQQQQQQQQQHPQESTNTNTNTSAATTMPASSINNENAATTKDDNDDLVSVGVGASNMRSELIFVPDIVLHAIPVADDLEMSVVNVAQAVTTTDRLVQLARFFFVLKVFSFPMPPECASRLSATIQRAEQHFATMTFQNRGVIERKLQLARDLSVAATASSSSSSSSSCFLPSTTMLSALPTASELQNFKETFKAENLPVLTNSRSQFKTQHELVSAHLKLLRADVCESTANIVSAALFSLPGATLDERTMSDLSVTRTFSNVRFVGRTCSRHFERCSTALLEFTPDEKAGSGGAGSANNADGQRPIDKGALMFLSTNDDPTTVTEDQTFWLVVESGEEFALLSRNIIAVSPANTRNNDTAFSQDDALTRLQAALERNERRGTAMMANRMIETKLFLFGYEPVFRALSSFLIPTSPVALPMPDEFFGPDDGVGMIQQPAATATSNKKKANINNDTNISNVNSSERHVPPGVVPVQFQDGFNHIVQSIRTRNKLDSGQDLAMRSLANRRLILVQGPPGTGKSFIGCRIVEAYVRYKHALRNGSMLQHIDPLLLSGTSDNDLAPSMGPIVIITYKNHALDEFLLDLKRSGLWGSVAAGTSDNFSRNSVVRIGSGSVAEELQEVNISRLADMMPSAEVSQSYGKLISIVMKIEAVTREIAQREQCRVGAAQFASWLTTEQRERFFTSPSDPVQCDADVEAFLSGERGRAAPSSSKIAADDAGAKTKYANFRESIQSHLSKQVSIVLAAASSTTTSSAGVADNNTDAASAAPTSSGKTTTQQNEMNNSLTPSPPVVAPTTEAQAEEDPEFNEDRATLDAKKKKKEKREKQKKATTTVTDDADGAGDGAAAAEDEELEDDDEEEEANADTLRLSTFAAIRRELMSVNKRFRHNDAGMTAYISREALALARQHKFSNPTAPKPVTTHQLWSALQSVWSLSPAERHEFAAANLKQEIAQRARRYVALARDLELAVALHQHLKQRVKMELLRTADVVGLTTTGCAINQDLLRSIEPQVIVVEEAAEVLESQLLACLPESLKQIVLIGDHYQLQPAVETYRYDKHNHLSTSLFERLVRDTRPILLTEQRRMRTEICDMVRPFYSEDGQSLEDHGSVRSRLFCDRLGRTTSDRVPGLAENVFFWSHNSPEQEAIVGRSIINLREISLTVMLVQHLIDQKLHPTSISVITPYLGQYKAIQVALRQHRVEAGVRVSTVDKFQGDEADVIILSLVRTAKITDFIRYRNRLIVAASRARFAMVFVGNDALLQQSPHWKRMLAALSKRKLVGSELPVTFGYGPNKVAVKVPSTAKVWPSTPAGAKM